METQALVFAAQAHDPEFAKTYLAEKRLLLEVLTEGDPTLYAEAYRLAYEPLPKALSLC